MSALHSAFDPVDDWRAEQQAAAAQEPDRSRILFQCGDVEQTSYGIRVSLGEMANEGKAAFWENEASTLWDSLEMILSIEDVPTDGWYLVDGFKAHYYRSYEGEYDSDYEFESIRPARWSDALHFGYPIPLWARLLLLIGVDRNIPPSFMRGSLQ